MILHLENLIKHRDEIECPMLNELFTYKDKINELKVAITKLDVLANSLEHTIIQKYPLLYDMKNYYPDATINREYVYYINNKHQSVQSRD